MTVVCGKGKNGGDGRICARVLRDAGREVTVVDEVGDLGGPDVIVDALLGIGLEGPPREDAARMIDLINAAARPVVAVDVPSGVNASTGEVAGVAVRATATVTFGAAKVGLAVAPGSLCAGAVTIAPLGLRPREHEHSLVPASVLLDVPRKQTMSTKYSAGSVLVVGGSRGLTGAPMLAAQAAFRADAGYVAVGAPESTLPVLEAVLLEAVKRPLPEDGTGRLLPRAADAILEAAEKADAVAIGPGLGRSEGTVELVRILLERLELPVVLDADALWELQPFTRAAPTVLTPHSGELAGLLGTDAREIDAHRLDAVRRAGVALRRGGAAEGSRHAGRRSAHRGARGDLRDACARDRRLRRRAHRRRRRVSREGDGGAVRRGRRRRRSRRRRPSSSTRRRASSRRTSCPSCVVRSAVTACSARRSRSRDAQRSHDRPRSAPSQRGDAAARARRCGALGGRQGGCVRPRRGRLRSSSARRGCDGALRRDGSRSGGVATRLPQARILVMGPVAAGDVAAAREARLELAFSGGELPEGNPIHLKLDTGHGALGPLGAAVAVA